MENYKENVNEELYAEVAKSMGISKAQVKEIVESGFSYLKDTLERRLYENVRFPYLGCFKAKKKQQEWFAKKKRENQRKKKEELYGTFRKTEK